MSVVQLIVGYNKSEPTGMNITFVDVPDDIWAFETAVPGALMIGGPTPGFLNEVAMHMAHVSGHLLHHAEFKLTDDPETVEWGVDPDHPDCAACLGQVDVALAFLADNPGRALCVGRVFWAERPSAAPGPSPEPPSA